jgi:CelD/BcsL family acetyltransferase involved in cellulose biosynthesis
VRLVRFLGAGVSDELGPVCAPEYRRPIARLFARHADEVMSTAGVFLCERLWDDDPLVPMLGAGVVHRIASPVLPIEGRTFEEYLADRSRNFRQQVRRRERHLVRDHGLSYRLTEDPDRLEQDMRTMIRLHTARWWRGESIAFEGSRMPFHLDFARRALEKGWLRLWTLELGGRPAAMWYGLRFGAVDWFYQSGRDPALDHLNVGFVLLCHSIRCAIEDGQREYRLGSGDEAYKQRFTDHHPNLETVAMSSGATGKLALAAVRSVLRTPKRIRNAVIKLS